MTIHARTKSFATSGDSSTITETRLFSHYALRSKFTEFPRAFNWMRFELIIIKAWIVGPLTLDPHRCMHAIDFSAESFQVMKKHLIWAQNLSTRDWTPTRLGPRTNLAASPSHLYCHHLHPHVSKPLWVPRHALCQSRLQFQSWWSQRLKWWSESRLIESRSFWGYYGRALYGG